MPLKILHTADWHLGKSLGSISRHPEQIEVLNEICEIADREQVHAVIVAGDLFDAYNPPVDSVELFYRMLKRMANDGKRVVIAIAGNHDSPERIESPDPLARECGIIFVGNPNTRIHPFRLPSGLVVIRSDEGFIEIKLPHIKPLLRVIITPYANERKLKTFFGIDNPEESLRQILEQRWKTLTEKYCDADGVNVLVTHLFLTSKDGERLTEPDDEKPILDLGGAQAVFTDNIPKTVQYVALGHLHRRITLSKDGIPIIYSGSPLSYSLSEAEQTKSVIIVEIEKGQLAKYRHIELRLGKKVVRKKFTSVAEAVSWLEKNPDMLVELTIETDTYLTANERKSITSAHEGIIDIIPIVKNADTAGGLSASPADLSKSVEELFKDFFKHETGQAPNKEIMNLFVEILRTEEE